MARVRLHASHFEEIDMALDEVRNIFCVRYETMFDKAEDCYVCELNTIRFTILIYLI